MPIVSVLMSAYAEPESIFCKAVDSILNQSFQDLELVIVLDNPENTTLLKVIRSYAENDERIRPLINKRNLGLAGSLNVALENARGEYICRMDADDISEHSRIESQLLYLQDSKLDLVGSAMTVINEEGAVLYPVDMLPESAPSVAKALRFNNCVPHPTWFGTRQVFSLGYRSVPLCEDYDFLVRATINGYRIGNIPEKLLRYRMSAESISRTHLYEQFLYQIELTKAYRDGAVLNIHEANRRVERLATPSKAQGYSHANQLFNAGLSAIRNKHFLSALANFARVPFVSPEYMRKVTRLIMASLIH